MPHVDLRQGGSGAIRRRPAELSLAGAQRKELIRVTERFFSRETPLHFPSRPNAHRATTNSLGGRLEG